MGWWKICESSTDAIPVVVKLKDPHVFPHKKQHPLKPEVKEGLKPIIENLKEQGLLIPCNSPCNTPILGIKKSNGKWRLVQDLRIINEAVVPLHPVVPNPYILFSLGSWIKESKSSTQHLQTLGLDNQTIHFLSLWIIPLCCRVGFFSLKVKCTYKRHVR